MLSLVFFLIIVALLIALVEKRFEFVFPVSVLLMLPLLTLLGMLHALSSLSYVLGFSLLLFLLALFPKIKKKGLRAIGTQTLSFFFTPAFVIFVLSLFFLAYFTQNRLIWMIDEVRQWALEPKLLQYYDGFAQGSSYVYRNYANYTPALPLYFWWATHIMGTFVESSLFFTLFSLFTTFSLPLFSKIRWSQWWLIPVCVLLTILFPVIGNQISYDFICADTALAYCFAFALMQLPAVSQKDPFALLSLCVGGIGMIMIKEVGLLFWIFVAVFFLVYGCHHHHSKRVSVTVFLIPILTYGMWLLYCHYTQRIGYHSASTFSIFSQMIAGTYLYPENTAALLPALIHALTVPLGRVKQTLLPWPRWIWLALMPLLAYGFSFVFPDERKRLRRLSLTAIVLCALLLLFQYISFFTVFYSEFADYTGASANNMIELMHRYLAPVSIGFLVFFLFMLLSFPKTTKTQKIASIATLCVLFSLVLLATNWGYMQSLTTPPSEEYLASQMVDDQYYIDSDSLSFIDDPQNAHILTGYVAHCPNMTYVYAPYRFTAIENVYSGDDLKTFIRENHFTHLIIFGGEYGYNGNPSLYALVSEMYPYEPIEIGFLYTIVWDGDEIYLELT